MTYRRREWSDTWHFDPTCTLWPTLAGERSNRYRTYRPDEIKSRKAKPTTHELCDQCRRKARR